MKKKERKKISFVLFVMSIFFAGVVLAEFHSSVWMVIIAGVELAAASVFFIWEQETKGQSASEKTADILFADRMGEWMRSNEKAEKGVYIAVKKQHEAMAEGMSALEEKLSEAIKAQENSIKMLILYNKENAKQLALSEREELGRLRSELQDVRTSLEALAERIQNQGGVGTAAVFTPEAEPEEAPDLGTEPQSVFEPEPVSEPMPETEPDLGGPEPTISEPEPEPTTEDALTSSGVDLSDPNRALSADDIAALFAAMGN